MLGRDRNITSVLLDLRGELTAEGGNNRTRLKKRIDHLKKGKKKRKGNWCKKGTNIHPYRQGPQLR